jgi:predicted phosphodiesterase
MLESKDGICETDQVGLQGVDDMTLVVGIMGDSHGQAATIRGALAVFADVGCDFIYHLGDVCDSTLPETADTCMDLLLDNGVITIKGNNDQAIVANHIGREKSPVSLKVLQLLKNLDLEMRYRNAIFIHSLPFVQELGLSSMIGVMGKKEIRRFFKDYPKHILFRGHSHSPEIAWVQDGELKATSLVAGSKLRLLGRIPCVVTCGALTRGWCMIWNPEENYIESISFR